ncbi:MAG: Asp-tRNA(Asn)/Glu-tRNA(Gln) amidotransferase GatCAB subunit A [Azospirillum brasilense]|nr:MAG: Asp-tRNA(Asn)/Glu-tRNA(Gln) amidotransferase GatCAB subunit A [Azospirillum brasilense]
MSELCFLTIAEASRRIRARSLSPVELCQAYLDRIDAVGSSLDAYILVLREQALVEARKAEAEITAGGWKGPLHGIPVGIKDIYDTAGIATTGHSALCRDRVPEQDATTVRLLREAGAVILGKTATWEFAIGGVSFDLPWPPARNPWDTTLDPAGSSSGSGAAVAAGLCMGAMGTDTGGSIRSPAAWNGIAGLKPTYGLVSRRGVLPLSFTLDHAGPMCWTAEDCALMMQVLAAHDPQDPGSADPGPIDFTGTLGGDLAGLRIGVVRHFFEQDAPADTVVLGALEQALGFFQKAGATLKDVSLAPLETYYDLCALIMGPESFSIHQKSLTGTPELYGAVARKRIAAGAFISGTDYVNALRLRARLVAQAAEVMKEVDVLVMPTRHTPPEALGQFDTIMGHRFYTRPFNVLGLPALSVCSGFTGNGLPLSMQIVGRPFEDALVLKVGDAFEKGTAFRQVRPVLQPEAIAAQ